MQGKWEWRREIKYRWKNRKILRKITLSTTRFTVVALAVVLGISMAAWLGQTGQVTALFSHLW